MPRAGWVLAEDIELALEYDAGNHNPKLDRHSSNEQDPSADYIEPEKGSKNTKEPGNRVML
jgi:hypothetical protein